RPVGTAGCARSGTGGDRPRAQGLRRGGVLAAGHAHRAPVPRRARGLGDGADGRSSRRLHREGPHRPAAVLGGAMGNSILMGAVAYDPKVVTIWEGIRAYFRDAGVDFDFALFSNYERQVEELLAG